MKELKEKEQENRISKLKIKEMKRLIKHNQLKPLSYVEAGREPENKKQKSPTTTKKQDTKKIQKEGTKPKGWSLEEEMGKEPPKEILLKMANKDLLK